MEPDDMILVSVDDHVVEPPDLFEGRLPAKYADVAPKYITREDGTNAWLYEGIELGNVALNAVAGRPPEEYGMEPTSLDEIRPGLLRHRRAGQRHGRQRRARLAVLPVVPAVLRPDSSPAPTDKDVALAMVQAYNDWHIDEWCGSYPGRFIPCPIPAIWDPEVLAAEVRRSGGQGGPRGHLLGEPVQAGLAERPLRPLGPVLAGVRDENVVVCMHIGSSSEMVITSPDAPIDVLITLTPINIVQAAADLIWSPVLRKFPDLKVALSEGGIGWIPVLPRADRLQLPAATTPGPSRTSATGSRARCSTSTSSPASSTMPSDWPAGDFLNMDNVTWECDYPHSDTTWPTAPEQLDEAHSTALRRTTSTGSRHLNAMRHFSYDPFAVIPKEEATVRALRARATGRDVGVHSTRKGPQMPKATRAADLGAFAGQR